MPACCHQVTHAALLALLCYSPVPDFTRQQLDAIEARGTSVVLSSGAGCGKTTVLTERFLSHLKSDGVAVGQIVAITFTDRAAREMRGRIRKAVTEAPKDEASRNEWAKHLRDLESASIQTIHSFCGDLLRQFAVPAGLDPHFEVLEEVLADNLRADALRDTLQDLLTTETPAGQDLCELVVLYGCNAVVEAVRSLLKERDTAAWKSWLIQTPADIARQWSGPKRDALLPVWIEYLLAAAPKIVHLINLFRNTNCVGPLMRANLDKVLDGLPKLAQSKDLAAAVEELCEAAKVSKEKGEAWPDAETYESIKTAMTEFRKDLPEKLALWMEEPDGVDAAAINGQRFVRVALTVVEAYQARKARVGAVDFQDLLVMARDLLRDRQDVREALQRRFRFLLLDEMQDTDPVQMELVENLCGIGMAHDKLFAVGDAKQSIYRFRGAEVALFERLRAAVRQEGRLALTRNYRSQPGILNFVNALCSLRLPDYEPLVSHHEAVGSGPWVEFLWSIPAEGVDDESAANVRAREADAIARHINELIASSAGRIREDKGVPRGVTPGDVVLLFRSMSNVSLYEAALRKHGLDYYLVGGRAFFAQQEVYDLLNLLRTLENPDDSLALAGTLRSPFACLADDSLVLLAMHPEGLWAGLYDSERGAILADDQQPRVRRIGELLNKWRGLKDRLPIARLIGVVFADTGYDAAMQFEFLGDRKLANLWKLVDMARSFDNSGVFGLADFIARLGDLVTNQPREEQAATQPENANVVRIMSIHQAKGLEFPVVFVPDLAARGLGGRVGSARWDRDLGCLARPPDEDPPLFTDFAHQLGLKAEAVADWQEDLRVLYVACTRARDLLVLSAGLPEAFPANSPTDRPVPVKAPNTWMLALGERFHLATGTCLDRTIPELLRPSVVVQVVTPVVELPASLARREEPVPREFGRWNISPVLAKPWPAIVPVVELDGELNSEFRRELRQWDLVTPLERSQLLGRFAASEWPGRLRAAGKLLRDVEYLSPWPGTSTEDRPALRGTIDFLWHEPDGWHVLALDAGEKRTPAVRMLEAWVVSEQFSTVPASATVFDLHTDTASHLDTARLNLSNAWQALAEQLDLRYAATK
jgi:ATP-dependent helicase/nuclease subunit A